MLVFVPQSIQSHTEYITWCSPNGSIKADFHEANNSLKRNILRRKSRNHSYIPVKLNILLRNQIFLTNKNQGSRFAANYSAHGNPPYHQVNCIPTTNIYSVLMLYTYTELTLSYAMNSSSSPSIANISSSRCDNE